MPRAKSNKLYRTFVKGLITEASPLTYPADASVDEVNTLLSRKGNRTRRKGIRYESGHILNNVNLQDGDAVNEYIWYSVAKVAAKAVVAIQIGHMLHFWEKNDAPMSDDKLEFTIDLNFFKAESTSAVEVRNQMCSFSSGAGYLFVAHPACDPFVVEYLPDSDTYVPVKIVIQIRDLEGVYDGLANDEEPSTLSNEHLYNLKNQGWVTPGEGPVPSGGNSAPTTNPGTYYDPYTGTPIRYYPGGTYQRTIGEEDVREQ